MSAAGRIALSAAAGAALCCAFALFAPSADDLAAPRTPFPPDLVYWLERLPQGALLVAPASAGALAGIAIIAALSARGGSPARLAVLALALFNPLALFALNLGAPGALFFAAALLLWRAVIALAAGRDAGATVALGAAGAMAPFLSNSILALYPLLLPVLLFLSPWGAKPRPLAGYMTAVAAPFILACLAAGYLIWLFGAPHGVAGPEIRSAPSADTLLILAGGFLIALAGRFSSLLALAAAMLGSAGLLAAERPDVLSWLTAALR